MSVSPPAGYYPDPSEPGYVTYWDGAAWVPTTRRPAGGIPDQPARADTEPVGGELGAFARTPTPWEAVPAAESETRTGRSSAAGATPLPWEAEPSAWASLPDLGGSGARLAARLVDLVIVLVVTALPGLPVLLAIMSRITDEIRHVEAGAVTRTVFFVNGDTAGLWLLYAAIMLLVAFAYEVWQLSRWGQTVGKRLMNIRVSEKDGVRNPSFRQATRRWLVSYGLLYVPVLNLLDPLWLLWDSPYQQALHDKAAGTIVVNEMG